MRYLFRFLFITGVFLWACDNGSGKNNQSNNITNNSNNNNHSNNNQNNNNDIIGADDVDTQDVPDAGNDADADVVEPEPDWWMAPAARCTPQGSPCAAAPAMPGVFASYRKDFYLPSNAYREPNDAPVNGGRFQIVANAAISGRVTGVRINGTPVDALLREPDMEWYHVWPTQVMAGEPVWFHFHSRNPAWDSAASGHLTIETTGGVAVDADFPVGASDVRLTYVTTSADRTMLLVHLKNEAAAPRTLLRLWVNGRDAAARGACIPKTQLEPQESLLITVPLCTSAVPGDPWSVVAEFAETRPAVGSGRVVRPHFPIETWVNSSDCAFPGGNTANFNRHRQAGFDTHYMYWGPPSGCTFSPATVVNQLAPALGDFFVLIGDDFLHYPNPETAITDTSAVAGFLTGDESDGSVYENGVPLPADKAQKARTLWGMYPDIAVYNGAKTNRNVGSFAGMTDIQGIDFYVAACAPHITDWGFGVHLRGAYDYLLNTRNNHMPLPTWMYAQGLHTGWNKSNFITTIHVQPDPQEIIVQAVSVLAAGGKGLMWFQSTLSEADHAPVRWEAISRMNAWVRRIREFVREGDINQLAVSPDDVIVDQIRSRRALIVPIISLATQNTVSDTDCAMTFTMESMVPHWILAPASVSVTVEIPADFGVMEVFEVTPEGPVDLAYSTSVSGRRVTVSGIPLDNTTPARILVFAADSGVRQDMM